MFCQHDGVEYQSCLSQLCDACRLSDDDAKFLSLMYYSIVAKHDGYSTWMESERH